MLTDRLTHEPYKRAFRAFLKKFNCAQLPYLVINRIRYSIVDIAAANIHRFSIAIYVFYLLIWPHLTVNDKNAFSYFRTILVRSILKIRAAIGHRVLLPWMKKVATITSVRVYKTEHKQLIASLELMKKSPEKLFGDFEMSCLNLQPLLMMLMIHNMDVSKCLGIMQRGALGLIGVTVPIEAKEATVLTLDYTSTQQVTEEDEEKPAPTRPTRVQEPDEIQKVNKCTEVDSRVTTADIQLSRQQNGKDLITHLYDSIIAAVIQRLEKMDSNFFTQTRDTIKDADLNFSTTTRNVERGFSGMKNLLKKNGKTRLLVLWAHGITHEATKMEIEEACGLTTLNTYRYARSLWDNHPSVVKYDILFFNKFMEAVRADWTRATKKALDEALRLHLLSKGVIEIEQSVTNDALFEYLEQMEPVPRDMPARSTADRALLLERCFKYFPEEIQKLIKDDKREKENMLACFSKESLEFINIFT
jgi:hypothetical protein